MADEAASNRPEDRFGDAYLPTRFGKNKQPDPKAVRKGILRKMRNRELWAAALQLPFTGNKEWRKDCAEYFDVDEDEITNEAMIIFKAIHNAMKNGDIAAAQMLMDRAYGKPKDAVEDHRPDNPTFNIKPVTAKSDNNNDTTIPIAESESGDGDGTIGSQVDSMR